MLCNKVDGETLKCTEACPTGALRMVRKDPDEIQRKVAIGTAEIDFALCYSYNSWSCGACYRACPFPEQAMKLGCKSYLAKPTTAQAIFDTVKEVAQTAGLLTLSERELQLRLSRLLRARRLRQDVTLTEMAQRIGLSKAQLSQIELGKSWPSFPTLKRISDELDQPFSELFKAIEQA